MYLDSGRIVIHTETCDRIKFINVIIEVNILTIISEEKKNNEVESIKPFEVRC